MTLYRAHDDAAEVEGRQLRPSQRFVPGGFFLGWLLENELAGAGAMSMRSRFVDRELTGPQAFERAGGELDERTVGPGGFDFALHYVHKNDAGLFTDMAEWFPLPSVFDVRDTWHNYEWMRIKLVERYSIWRAAGR